MLNQPTRALPLAALLCSTLLAGGLAGQSPPGAGRDGAAPPAASIVGLVVNAESGEPIAAATVRLLEIGRADLSHQDGTFHFDGVAAGDYTVAVQRLGFAPVQQPVEVPASGTTRLEIRLEPTAINIPGLVVTGTGRARSAAEAYRPTTVLDEAELRRRLSSSVAATLAGQPGIAQRYNGPAASQPVIRGLSGDRVLVLEDGARTGDISAGSADHAVTIEPLTAERIEVVRGPAGLLYGSNALGGVVNVVREEVPRTLPEGLSGTLSAQLESVNRGATAGGSVVGAVGGLALRGELSGRVGGDTRTPLGDLPSTSLEGYNGAGGASWVHDRGFAGLSVRDFSLSYGVPGSFNGEVIPGAHGEGVTIDLRRTSLSGQAGWFDDVGPFSGVEWDGRYTRFEQDELEPGGGVGTSFGQLTASSRLSLPHRHRTGDVRLEGAGGLWAHWQDLATAGSAGTVPAQELTLAGFLFEELGFGRARLQLGGRYDWTRISPRETGTTSIGEVRQREFGAASGSVALLWEARDGIVLGSSVSRAFRTPSLAELFSDGPHLADYSYNIGNPELEAEYGLGLDLFARAALTRVSGEVAVYRNWIDNYIHYAPTGRLDPRLQRFPVYQAVGDDALLQGVEGRVQWAALDRLVLDAGASYVHGTRGQDDAPLPAVPPLQGSASARYDTDRFFVSLGWQGAAEQDRVGEFEAVTPGYSLLQAGAGLRWSGWGDLHTLTLQVANLTDEVWYDHLSRIRQVAPQPGRNIELLYRVSF